MRNLVLILIFFMAVVIFIRAYEKSGGEIKGGNSGTAAEFMAHQ
jgi:hypothetical protein